MKTSYLSHGLFRLLNLLVPLLTIYVFWVINAPYRLSLPGGVKNDWIDLLVLAAVTALACLIVWIVDQQGDFSIMIKTGIGLSVFLLLAPLTGWLLYTSLFQLPFFQTPFLSIDLPLGLPVFIAWASTYFLRQRLRRIEQQHLAQFPDLPAKHAVASLGKVQLLPVRGS